MRREARVSSAVRPLRGPTRNVVIGDFLRSGKPRSVLKPWTVPWGSRAARLPVLASGSLPLPVLFSACSVARRSRPGAAALPYLEPAVLDEVRLACGRTHRWS